MRTLIAVTASALVLALTGSAAAQRHAAVTARSSSFGQILFDGRGFALYAFTKDAMGRSTCTGPCASAWPPDIVPSRPTAAAGVELSLLGTLRRSDGRLQATYAGRALYYYIGDRRPMQVRCQHVAEFGGVWLVLRPNGTLVR
jgi:predicted lipoprotein with Yx(FWY)xxD motif